MPIWLRKFTYEKIKKHYEDKKEAAEKQNHQLTNKGKDKKLDRPNLQPQTSYTAKAPKK